MDDYVKAVLFVALIGGILFLAHNFFDQPLTPAKKRVIYCDGDASVWNCHAR